MFNHALHEAQQDLKSAPDGSKIVNPSKQPNGYYVRTPEGFIYNPERINPTLNETEKVVVRLAVDATLALPAGRVFYNVYLIAKTPGYIGKIYTLEFANDVANPSMSPSTPHGAALGGLKNFIEY